MAPRMSEKRIEDYALIGDDETAALVHRSGAIEWLCFPRFDSEACLAALLGDRENGCWQITLRDQRGEPVRRYRGDSLILETELASETGKVRLIDFMPIRGEAPDVVRIVECIDGFVDVTSELSLRFDYGRIHPLVRSVSPARSVAIRGPDAVSLDFDAEIEFEDRRFASHVSLSEGERSCFVLTWFPSYAEVPNRVDPIKSLEANERYWAEFTGRIHYSGEYRDAVVRSLITLKALIHRQTGGMIAAPSASLPEYPGGSRNWDYRYCWLRDATFTLIAFLRTGLHEEAKAWIDWLRRAVGGEPVEVKPFYALDGDSRLFEWEADWLSGFNGSRPVRFGNRAEGQLQLDVFGEVIDALYLASELGVEDGEDTDHLIRMLSAKLEEIWQEPGAGIWESRGEPRQHVYSKVMCWVAFDRASGWFEHRNPSLAAHYRKLAEEVHAQVCERGFDDRRQAFVRAYDDRVLDAAVLRMPLVGFLPADDWRIAATVEAIERELCQQGFVRRYVPEQTDDGLEGSEGALVAASFWLAEVYQLQGRTEDAHELFERVVGRANDLGLLAEELALEGDGLLGNFPQGLSHLSLVHAADRFCGGSSDERHAEEEGS
jgi:GH15 family glucan-1,4-alpha-glucosidase